MEASSGAPLLHTASTPTQPDIEKFKQKLLQTGVFPTPKIIHTLCKKQLQKSLRKSKRRLAADQSQPLTDSQKQAITEDAHFQTLKAEYKSFNRAIVAANSKDKTGVSSIMIGKPWEGLDRLGLRELSRASNEYGTQKLKSEHLTQLSDILENELHKFCWLLDDDIELEEGWFESQGRDWAPPMRRGGEAEAIRFLVDRLSGTELTMRDWKFSRMMKQSGLQFTEGQLLKIVEGLGDRGQWRHALSVVEWVYSSKEHRHYKSRFVYTKLLAVLGQARRAHEALQIFNLMRGDCRIYPDMPAYHSVAVTLGQAGLLKELLNIIECMQQKPSRKVKNMRSKNWDPVLQPDVVVFNALLNACVPSRQWKGVSWVFEQLRKGSLRPNGATYGLAMEVMLESGKYELVHKFFKRMKRSGEAPQALTYRVLVKAFWREGKVNEAVQAVRDMEQRGVVGTACVYYELACCLCNYGWWQEAMAEIQELKKLPRSKPLAVTFTGMILSSMDGGHVDDCLSIFEHCKDYCAPDIGMINAMLKVYGRNDMFLKAKELFEEIKKTDSGSDISLNDNGSSPGPDLYTFGLMLEASASALQWEYFEYVYKEMTLSGHQLDQSKHASLLVEASRAGKGYLLDHAFDKILEAGEIPHPSFFTEMLCEAAIQQDYERAVTILSSMAHAPFQVSKKQWTYLFEENRERISRAKLEELLYILRFCDLTMGASVLNLSRSLQALCGCSDIQEFSNSMASGNEMIGKLPSDNHKEGYDADGGVNMHNSPASVTGLDPCNDLQVDKDAATNVFFVNHIRTGKEVDAYLEIVSGFKNYDCNGDGREGDADTEMVHELKNYGHSGDDEAYICTSVEYSANDLAPNISVDSFDNNLRCNELGNLDANGFELIISTSKTGDSYRPWLPSAYEILETWKESRKKDGVFFPFQLGQKDTQVS